MSFQSLFPLMLIRSAGLPLSSLEALSADWKTLEKALLVGDARCKHTALALQTAFDAALAALEESRLRTAVYNARKDFYRRSKLPAADLFAGAAGEIVLPELADLQSKIHQLQKDKLEFEQTLEALERQYEEALQRTYAGLRTIAGKKQFQRALLFSSHALLGQLRRFCDCDSHQFAKKERQTALAVLQYAGRMAVKTSPLSRFTSVSIRALDEVAESDLLLETYSLSPNVALLEALYAVLLPAPEFYRSLSVTLNPSISSQAEGQYSWLFFNGETEGFQEMPTDTLLDHLVGLLLENGRQLPFETLLDQLLEVVEAERPDLENWLLELLDLGFLEWLLPESGLSPGWCGNLQRHLGFLPATPLIVETGALLQWLRAAARTIPYQALDEARQTQVESLKQVQVFFERRAFPAPPIPAEQVFYEDAVQAVEPSIPSADLEQLIGQLADCWRQRPERPMSAARERAVAFAREKMAPGESWRFLDFCRAFAEATRPTTSSRRTSTGSTTGPTTQSRRTGEKIGALLQCFQENGRWYAVVNGLYPGGGKLFARWLHLFSPDTTQQFSQWLQSPIQGSGPNFKFQTSNFKLPFPWQGYFNANFQPSLGTNTLLVPGGRLQAKASGQEFLLGNLELYQENEQLQLRDSESGQQIELTDLGLEAPETRPPAMQLLWQLGVPYVSLEALLVKNSWRPIADGQIQHRPRQCFQNLVLARAAWSVAPEVWQAWLKAGLGLDFFKNLRTALSELEIPRYFFARFEAEKPQYFDQNSPLLLQLFEKQLRQGGGALTLTEMLPLPEHWICERQGQRVQELVIELEV